MRRSSELGNLRRLISTWCRESQRRCVVLAVAIGLHGFSARAAEPGLTLPEAMRRAATATPGAREDAALRRSANARVRTTRSDLLPELSVGSGVTVGTGNVVPGAIFDPPGYPTLRGPPTAVDMGAGWQVLGGVTLRLDLLGLLGKVRDVDVALAAARRTDARADAEQHARAVRTGLAWLDAAEAAAAVEVARADVERGRRLLEVAGGLADAGVKPDVDRALAASELALAEQRLSTAQGQAAARKARLAVVLGERPTIRHTLAAPPASPPDPAPRAEHPALREAASGVAESDARVRAARARFAPRLDLLAAADVRAGTWPPGDRVTFGPNWAVGLVLEVPLLDPVRQRSRVRSARADADAAAARRDGVRLEVDGQVAEAEALLQAARRSAAQSGKVVDAANVALQQAETRYEAGLVDVTPVATALAQAREADLAALQARFDVLGAALARDYARGDLTAWMELDR
jgi:outer membrane protein TolC